MARADARPARNVPGYRRFMPALMPTRVGSTVYFDQRVHTEEAEQFVAEVRSAHPDVHATFFDVVLWAMVRTLDRHPHLNRFTAGGRVYDRSGIWISYTAKTELTEAGTLVEVKRRFDPRQSFVDMARAIESANSEARRGDSGLVDRELDLFLRLPPVLRRAVVRAAGAANALNVLPSRFIEEDPFFASAFVTNLGSVGLDAAFHHLYEYGTIPIFCAVGRIHDEPVVEDGGVRVGRVASLKFSYDERIEDGLYAGRALRELREFVEHPSDGVLPPGS